MVVLSLFVVLSLCGCLSLCDDDDEGVIRAPDLLAMVDLLLDQIYNQ